MMTQYFALLAVLASVAITAAVPGYAGLELRTVDKLQGFDIVDLHVKHPDFEGIFTGTADFIYKEFKTLKPEVFINDTSAASNNVLPLEKRQTNGEINCDWEPGSAVGINASKG